MASPVVQLLPPLTITTAITGQIVAGPIAVRSLLSRQPRNLTVLGKFTYGSGGTTASFWVQTSFDGGATWTDICVFSQLLASRNAYFNFNTQTPITTILAQQDAGLSSDASKDGTLGPLLRVKATTTGTYAGGTTMEIDIVGEPT